MEQLKNINHRVFTLMKDRKISGYRIMKDLDIPEGTISQARHNKINFTVPQLAKIAEYFKVSIDYLIHGKEFDSKGESEKIKELIQENEMLKDELKKTNTEIMVFDKIKNLVYDAKRKK